MSESTSPAVRRGSSLSPKQGLAARVPAPWFPGGGIRRTLRRFCEGKISDGEPFSGIRLADGISRARGMRCPKIPPRIFHELFLLPVSPRGMNGYERTFEPNQVSRLRVSCRRPGSRVSAVWKESLRGDARGCLSNQTCSRRASSACGKCFAAR